jgi:hypothetical protein
MAASETEAAQLGDPQFQLLHDAAAFEACIQLLRAHADDADAQLEYFVSLVESLRGDRFTSEKQAHAVAAGAIEAVIAAV